MLSQLELDAAPKVTLAGKEYPVPMLVPRQQRIVLPKMLALMKSMTDGGGGGLKLKDISNFSTEQYDDLCDVVFVGLTRGSPSLTRDQFLDLETNLPELLVAMDVIAQQTRVMKRAAPGEQPQVDPTAAAPGEASAGSSGTASLPA